MRSSISSFRRFLVVFAVLTAALLLTISAATEAMIRTYVEPIDLFEQSVDIFMKAETDNAFFGDSIVAAGIIPETGDYVNLAIGGESPAMMIKKVKIFFGDKKSGRAVLPANVNMVTRQLSSFADYDEVLTEEKRPPIRLMTPRHRAYAFDYWRTFLFDNFSTRRKLLRNGGEVFSDPALNSLFLDKSEEERQSNARGKFAEYLNVDRNRVETNKAIFRDMIGFLRDRGIETCLLSYPMAKELRILGEDHDLIDEGLTFFRDLAAENGMTYVNARDLFSEPDMFIDATHMSEPAARVFTGHAIQACFGSAPGSTN